MALRTAGRAGRRRGARFPHRAGIGASDAARSVRATMNATTTRIARLAHCTAKDGRGEELAGLLLEVAAAPLGVGLSIG